MRFLIEQDLDKVNETKLADYLRELPVWRRERAMTYRFHANRVQSVMAFRLLESLLGEAFGVAIVDEFKYGKFGKPRLGDRADIHFNLSHCSAAVACAVSDEPVGIDVETISAEHSVEFLKDWTRKEAYLKLIGRGLVDDLQGVLANPKVVASLKFTTEVNETAGYVMTICEFNPLKRGLIEVSNRCQKNCRYCGIRAANGRLDRYHLTEDEVLASADEAVRRGYGAIALQAGELESEDNTRFYENVLRRLGPMEVTLSLGEQEEEVYRRWKQAAGDRVLRYLLRIETSNRELYAKLHPANHSFERRVECIRTLKRLGYVTGSGVMIGLPGQTKDDLKRDLDWFEAMHLDMVGMGPFVPCAQTEIVSTEWSEDERLELTEWMIGEVRRRMPEVNIVSATALEALSPIGRYLGLAAGANVIMPNVTPAKYRECYRLYPGKTECVK